MNTRRISQRVLIVLPLLLATGGCTYGPLDNKGYIAPDAVRMAQPDAADLAAAVEQDHIKSIVNLRGVNAGKDWYDAEKSFAEANAVTLYSVRLSKSRLPTREQLGDLIRIFKTADRPLLMHCQSGVDRSSFAAVVYRLVVLNEPLDTALESLSLRHGHIGTNPIDKVFDAYREESAGRTFEEWFEKDYDLARLNKKYQLEP